jgi:MerR family transcriptional regulator, light-induced transcriptional regulator
MGKYSIKELEKLSGIKAHTIRIWEKRYQIVVPQRTDSNIRSYSDDDLKKIINISLLNNNGVKISKIADLTSDQLAKKVSELTMTTGNLDIHIDQLIVAMVDLEEENFERVLGEMIVRYGFEKTIVEIVYPFLNKIGILWQTNNITPAQEHFISNLIRQKIIVAIDALSLAPKTSTRVLLFLPEDELHELGLLFYYYIVKKAGFRTYYFGQMVPYKDVVNICNSHQPKILITAIISSPPASEVQAYLTKLCNEQPQCSVLAAGRAISKIALKLPSNLHPFSNAKELTQLLNILK